MSSYDAIITRDYHSLRPYSLPLHFLHYERKSIRTPRKKDPSHRSSARTRLFANAKWLREGARRNEDGVFPLSERKVRERKRGSNYPALSALSLLDRLSLARVYRCSITKYASLLRGVRDSVSGSVVGEK